MHPAPVVPGKAAAPHFSLGRDDDWFEGWRPVRAAERVPAARQAARGSAWISCHHNAAIGRVVAVGGRFMRAKTLSPISVAPTPPILQGRATRRRVVWSE